MSGSDLTAREREILRILDFTFKSRVTFSLVGGYAVNAYSDYPRYSAVCDIVISRTEHERFATILAGEGFTKKRALFRNELEGLETIRYSKLADSNREVSVELMIGGVRCRQTEAVWKQEEIMSQSAETIVVGVTGSVDSIVAVRELLIAMKLHSGRDTDLRDVVMLTRAVNWNKVFNLVNRGVRKKFIEQLTVAALKTSEPAFEQDLKAAFGRIGGEKKRISEMLNGLKELQRQIRM